MPGDHEIEEILCHGGDVLISSVLDVQPQRVYHGKAEYGTVFVCPKVVLDRAKSHFPPTDENIAIATLSTSCSFSGVFSVIITSA